MNIKKLLATWWTTHRSIQLIPLPVSLAPSDTISSGEMLWTVVNGWPHERKTQFLAFVTGSPRLPLPGSELLKVEAPFVALGAAEHRMHLGMLPQAHTCDNLLELPNYWQALLQIKGYRNAASVPPDQLPALREECAKILEDRLSYAISCYSGYGLDQRGGSGDDF